MKTRLIKARISLLVGNPFFGRLCMLLKIKETDRIPIMATDGKYLFYNKRTAKKLSKMEIKTVIAHEVLHCVLGHLWRRDKREPFRWNFACDYAVNLILENNKFVLPKGILLNHSYIGMNAEAIYEKLPKPKKKAGKSAVASAGGGSGKKKKKKDDPNENHKFWEKSPKKGGKGNKKGKKWKNSKLLDKIKEQANKKRQKRLKKMWESATENAIKTTQRGSIPAGLERLVEEMEPKEDWKKILSAYLSSSFTDFNFSRRDRRTFGWDFYLPDLQDIKTLRDVIAVVDTSGSISGEELNQFLSEIKKILKVFPKVTGWLIECDAEVGRVLPIEKAKGVENFTGGGGTSHVPVFEEIKERNLTPRVVICFTDMYTEFPDEKPNYPVLWLSTTDEVAPFGRTIRIRDNL